MSFPEQAVRSLVITTGMKNAGKGNAAGYFPHGSAFPLPSTPHQNMTDENGKKILSIIGRITKSTITRIFIEMAE